MQPTPRHKDFNRSGSSNNENLFEDLVVFTTASLFDLTLTGFLGLAYATLSFCEYRERVYASFFLQSDEFFGQEVQRIAETVALQFRQTLVNAVLLHVNQVG
jgi:hypothetical protein